MKLLHIFEGTIHFQCTFLLSFSKRNNYSKIDKCNFSVKFQIHHFFRNKKITSLSLKSKHVATQILTGQNIKSYL